MIVSKNDVVLMKDGRIVKVTDAADQDPMAYDTYNESGELVSTMPVETIFVGTHNHKTVVSDMSEVVSILK